MKVDIYFPGVTYHENKDTLKRIISKFDLKWIWARSTWESNENRVVAEFSGHMQPALLHVEGEQKFVDLMTYVGAIARASLTYEGVSFCLTKVWLDADDMPSPSQLITKEQLVQIRPKDYSYRDAVRAKIEIMKEKARLMGIDPRIPIIFALRDMAAAYRNANDIPLTGILTIHDKKKEDT